MRPAGALALASENCIQLSAEQQKQAAAAEQALRKNPDALDPTMQYVYEVERTTAPMCPDMSVADRALLVLAGQAGGTSR